MSEKSRPVCGARRRDGKRCQSTAVMANGRCRVHGGKAGRPVSTGRYARVAKGRLAERLSEDTGDVSDMTREIALVQALTELVVEKLDPDVDGLEQTELLAAIAHLAKTVNLMQSRMIRAHNETALTAAEVKLLQAGILTLIDEFVTDPDRRRACIARLAQLVSGRVAGTERASLPGGGAG